MSKSNPIPAIKDYCRYSCCSGHTKKWLECHATQCPLHPFRLGNNPYRKPKQLDPEVKDKLRDNLVKAREIKEKLRIKKEEGE